MRTHKEGALQGHRTQCESILITHYEDACPIRMHIENSLCKGSIEYEQNNDIDIRFHRYKIYRVTHKG